MESALSPNPLGRRISSTEGDPELVLDLLSMAPADQLRGPLSDTIRDFFKRLDLVKTRERVEEPKELGRGEELSPAVLGRRCLRKGMVEKERMRRVQRRLAVHPTNT